jgi:hypothetical protein
MPPKGNAPKVNVERDYMMGTTQNNSPIKISVPKPDFPIPVALVHGLRYGIPSKRILASIRTENRNALQGSYVARYATAKRKAERMHTFKGKANQRESLGKVSFCLAFFGKPLLAMRGKEAFPFPHSFPFLRFPGKHFSRTLAHESIFPLCRLSVTFCRSSGFMVIP